MIFSEMKEPKFNRLNLPRIFYYKSNPLVLNRCSASFLQVFREIMKTDFFFYYHYHDSGGIL